jgi:hypothetical protein
MCDSNRHSIFCILPPHVLMHLARNGNNDEREFALRTLALDQTVLRSRIPPPPLLRLKRSEAFTIPRTPRICLET